MEYHRPGNGRTRLFSGALVLFAVVALASSKWSQLQFLTFDEGYNLYLSRTFASEHFYGTKLGSELRPFDPAVTTGFPVLLFLGFGFMIFGPSIGVAKALLVLLFVACVSALFWSFYFLFEKNIAMSMLSLVAILTIPQFLDRGLRALGEVLAVTLVVIAVTLLQLMQWREEPSPRRFTVLALVCVFLGVATKDILVLVSSSLVLVGLGRWVLRRDRIRKKELAVIVVGVTGLLTPYFMRLFYALCVRLFYPGLFSWYLAEAKARNRLLKEVVVFSPLANTKKAFELLLHEFPVQSISFLFAAVFVVVLLLVGLVYRQKFMARLGDALSVQVFSVAGVVWTAWFLFVSGPQANERHMFPGIVFMTICVMQVLCWGMRRGFHAEKDSLTFLRVGWAVLVGFLLLVGFGKAFSRYLERADREKRARAAQQAVVAWIQEHIPANEAIGGWGWYVPWHVAFLAGRTVSRADLHTYDLRGLTQWLVIIPEMGPLRQKDRRLSSLVEEEGRLLFKEGGYEIFKVLPSGEIRREPPKITKLYPERTRAGQGFNVQPSGASAIAVRGEHFTTRGSIVIANGHRLKTTFGSSTLLTAIFPKELFLAPGQIEVWVITENGTSNKLIFSVDP